MPTAQSNTEMDAPSETLSTFEADSSDKTLPASATSLEADTVPETVSASGEAAMPEPGAQKNTGSIHMTSAEAAPRINPWIWVRQNYNAIRPFDDDESPSKTFRNFVPTASASDVINSFIMVSRIITTCCWASQPPVLLPPIFSAFPASTTPMNNLWLPCLALLTSSPAVSPKNIHSLVKQVTGTDRWSMFKNDMIPESKGYAFHACMKKHDFGTRKT